MAAVLLDWRVTDVAAMTVFIDGRRANIQVSGRLDALALHQLRLQVESLLNSGITDLLVDLLEAYDLDPGLSELLQCASSMLTVREGLLLTESALTPLPGDITARPLTELFEIYQRTRSRSGQFGADLHQTAHVGNASTARYDEEVSGTPDGKTPPTRAILTQHDIH